MNQQKRQQIKDYYSQMTVDNGGEMVTRTCTCSADRIPRHIRAIIEELPEEITSRSYGCGSPIPLCLEGCTVLDLGCGTGEDVYVCSKLAGPTGKVIGIDMNEDQLAIARKHQDGIAAEWGFDNVEFIQGFIEDLSDIPDGSVDVVISNCVINLSPDKEQVFREIWRVLKRGGELCFSDIFADRRIPEELDRDLVLSGECLGGALYIEDFRRLMRRVGWEDFRYLSSCPATIDDEAIEEKIGNISFSSRTIRAYKLPDIQEDICEQYGQVATYKGGIPFSESFYDLDDHHRFFKDQPMLVCGNTCSYVQDTRFSRHFDVQGDRSQHFGPFEGCGNAPAVDGSVGGCCC